MTIKIIITGNVQGVFFRAFIKDRAVELGLRGYVKNMEDGTLEAVAQGSQDLLDKLVQFCHKGPTGAKIKEVKVSKTPDQEFITFEIKA